MKAPAGTENTRILAQINALLNKRSLKDVQVYEVDGVSLTRMTVEQLFELKNRYTTLVLAEKGNIFGETLIE